MSHTAKSLIAHLDGTVQMAMCVYKSQGTVLDKGLHAGDAVSATQSPLVRWILIGCFILPNGQTLQKSQG